MRVRTRRGDSASVWMGQFELGKIGAVRYDWRDPYHIALTVPWPAFVGGVFGVYALINLAFASLYFLAPAAVANARPGSFVDAVFFSVETLATVGYGEMYPGSLYGHWIAVSEITVGTAFTAIITGLIFVRFSRPKAKILYADNAVITPYNGLPTLMIRIGNGRMSLLTEARVGLSALIRERSAEGQNFRRLHDLALARSRLPVFALTLTLMHPIDADSPLYGHTGGSLADGEIRLFLSIEARDSGLGATVYDIKDYSAEQILFGVRYADAVLTDASGRTLADLRRISLVEPDGHV